MQVVQTAGLPPNHGRMRLLTSGCTWKSRNALRKIVNANRIKASSFLHGRRGAISWELAATTMINNGRDYATAPARRFTAPCP